MAATCSLLHAEITSYYPLATEPGWVETSVGESFLDGNTTVSEIRNLLGIDADDKIVMPIIPGFRGGNPIGVVNDSDGGDFDDPFQTQGKTDETVDADGITLWKTTVGSLNGGSGQGTAGIVFESTSTYQAMGPSGTLSEGALLTRRTVKIGEEVSTRYRLVMESTSSSKSLGIDLRSVTVTTVDHRSVFVGTDIASNLFPGSNPVLVTDPYSALVRVTETSSSGTSETFQIVDGVETSFGPEPTGGSTITSIEWLVKGVGAVRFLFAFGDWLDPIVENSLFNNGSNVVSAQTLEAFISADDLISEQLRVSGGSLADAADTVLTGSHQEIVLWPVPIEREIIFLPIDAGSQLAAKAIEAGLSGNDAQPGASPQLDGIPNILKFAFNMDLSRPAFTAINEASNFGLPIADVVQNGQTQTFQLKFVRQKNSALTYTPIYSQSPDRSSFVPLTGIETTTPINDSFERVCIDSTVILQESSPIFGLVKVEY